MQCDIYRSDLLRLNNILHCPFHQKLVFQNQFEIPETVQRKVNEVKTA